MEERLEAWKAAEELVAPIIEKHTLEPHKGSAMAFNIPPTFTKVDQHIGHIMDVANWLLKEN